MKKYASITIKAPTCNKNITIDITDCAGITEIFDKIDEAVRITEDNFSKKKNVRYIPIYALFCLKENL